MTIEKNGFLGEEIVHYQKRVVDDYKDILNFYVQANQFAQKLKYELKTTSTEVQKVTLITLFIKALLSYQSIYVLVTHCLTDDAENILRTLFDLMVRIKYCSLKEENFKRYIYSHNYKILGWIEEAIKHPDEFPKEMQTKGNLTQRKEELKKTLKEAGNLKKLRTQDMAKECGLMRLYNSFYRVASDGVHGNPSVLESYVIYDATGNIESFQIGSALDKESIARPLIIGIELLLIAISDLANFFAILLYKEEFLELSRRKEELARNYLPTNSN